MKLRPPALSKRREIAALQKRQRIKLARKKKPASLRRDKRLSGANLSLAGWRKRL